KLYAAKIKHAQDILSSLNEVDNDFAEKANQLNVSLSLQRVGEKASITELNTFDECFLRAKVELAQVKKLADQIEDAKLPAERDKLEKKRQDSFKAIIRSLSRGMAVA